MADPRETEWQSHEAASLAKGRCPHSGLTLHMDGEGVPGSASCDMCDCFGFNPGEVKVHPKPLNVARWKVTRRTCGTCGKGFAGSTKATVCGDCLESAPGLLPRVVF